MRGTHERAGYERQIAELHVMLQTAQHRIAATVAEDAPQTRSDAPGATNGVQPAADTADAPSPADAVPRDIFPEPYAERPPSLLRRLLRL